jgi:catechol 2,3-dioxygenase-like lactoylglutathione lyase family enzyme
MTFAAQNGDYGRGGTFTPGTPLRYRLIKNNDTEGTSMIKNAIASLAVSDLDRSRQWYSRLFEREPDSNPMPELIEWRFDHGGWLQVYGGPERAGGGSVTLSTDDIGDLAAHLHNLGIDTGDRPSGGSVKTIMIKDPDGNSIAFAETNDKTMAH